jgi:hypothetical protein
MPTRHTTLILLGLLFSLPLLAQQQPKSCPYDSAHFDLFHPVPRQQLRELRPDRPGVTESPFTVDAGHFQLETDALRVINSREDTLQSRQLHVAYALAKVGLSRLTDLQVELPLYSVQKDRGEHQNDWQRHSGLGDVAVRVKHNFLGDDQKGPVAMAVVAYTRLPTGGTAGSGGVEGGLIVPVNFELPHRWNLDLQVESDLNYDRDEANHYVRVMPSVALDHEFSDVFSFLVEGVTQWDAQHSGWHSSLNLAPIISVNDNLQLDLGTHLALSKETDREFFVGFTYRR